LIYDAGDARTTWISFWKAVALLQCGTTLVFAVPPLWKNENQPDVNLRKAQAILGEYCFSKLQSFSWSIARIVASSIPRFGLFFVHFVPSFQSAPFDLCLHSEPIRCFQISKGWLFSCIFDLQAK
jgi:hypothetical protein